MVTTVVCGMKHCICYYVYNLYVRIKLIQWAIDWNNYSDSLSFVLLYVVGAFHELHERSSAPSTVDMYVQTTTRPE